MLKRLGYTLIVMASIGLLAGCGNNLPPPSESASTTGKAVKTPAVEQVTLHVPDMTDRQGIT